MKNTTKKKGNPQKKLLPAVGSLLISAVMLGTSTYAWFTMNKEVEVTGMEMKTKVSGNLLICSDNVEANYSPDTLIEGRQALLEPVSSVTGATGSFFYTVDANARGQKLHAVTGTDAIEYDAYNETTALANSGAGKIKYDATFNSASKYAITTASSDTAFETAYGYVDYVFYLKGTSDAANQELRMTECNLLGGASGASAIGSGTEAGRDIDRAWRIAVFAQDITSNGGDGHNAVKLIDPAATGTGSGIYALNNAAYFETGKAVATSTTKSAITAGTGVLAQFPAANSTKYFKVTVRVWLEGEDDTCNSETYALLQNNLWKLNCKFELGTDTAAVTKINSDTTKTADTARTQTTTAGWNDPQAGA